MILSVGGRLREQVEELRDDAGHVDVGLEHPLQLQPVGDGLEDAGERLGLDAVGDPPGACRSASALCRTPRSSSPRVEEDTRGPDARGSAASTAICE